MIEIKEGVSVFKSLAQRFMMTLLGSIEKDCANNWTKFDYFFKLIYLVSIGGNVQLEFCFFNEMIVKLIDFFLGPASPLATAE